jgi:hypothetical protein
MGRGARILLTVRDDRGREIALNEEQWAHVKARHPELDDSLLPDLARELRSPYRIHYWPPREEWFYFKKLGPSYCLKVVVVFDRPERGRIITMFPRRSIP